MKELFAPLPQGWEKTNLGEITVDKVDQGLNIQQDVFTYIDISSIDNDLKQITEEKLIPTIKAPSRARQQVKKNDVLVSMTRPNLNAVAIVPENMEDSIASTGFDVLRAITINPKWIFSHVRSQPFIQKMEELVQGALYPAVKSRDVRSYEILLPPLPEQNRIVKKLEAFQIHGRTARKALDAVPHLLEKLRKSVLISAFRGDLTADWRAQNPQVGSAENLLKCIREERYKHWEDAELAKMKTKGIEPKDDGWKGKYKEPEDPDISYGKPVCPSSWLLISVGHIAECLDYMRVPVSRKVREQRTGPYPYYGANGKVGTIDNFLFDDELILVTEDETFYGRTKPIAYRVSGKCWVNNHAHVLRAFAPINPDFLCYALMYYNVFPWLSGTTGRAKLNQGALIRLPVALPPIEELVEITKRVDEIFSAIDKTLEYTAGQAQQLIFLDQSILAKAFRGELVPQDPNDEPASVLLERIKQEKASLGSGKKNCARRGRATKRL